MALQLGAYAGVVQAENCLDVLGIELLGATRKPTRSQKTTLTTLRSRRGVPSGRRSLREERLAAVDVVRRADAPIESERSSSLLLAAGSSPRLEQFPRSPSITEPTTAAVTHRQGSHSGVRDAAECRLLSRSCEDQFFSRWRS